MQIQLNFIIDGFLMPLEIGIPDGLFCSFSLFSIDL